MMSPVKKIQDYHYLLYLLSLIVLVSCQKDDDKKNNSIIDDPVNSLYVNIDKDNLQIGNEGGKLIVKVTANCQWNAKSDNDWMTVSPSEHTGNGELTITIKESKDKEKREGHINISGGGKTPKIKVVQEPFKSVLQASTDSIRIGADGGNSDVTITSNIAWEANSDSPWCSVDKPKGNGNDNMKITVTPNNLLEARTAIVSISGEGEVVRIKVNQDAQPPHLIISPEDSLTFNAVGGQQTFTVTSNVSWTISSNEVWCHVDKDSGEGDDVITVSLESWEDVSARRAVIFVQSAHLNKTLSIIQQGRNTPVIDDNGKPNTP